MVLWWRCDLSANVFGTRTCYRQTEKKVFNCQGFRTSWPPVWWTGGLQTVNTNCMHGVQHSTAAIWLQLLCVAVCCFLCFRTVSLDDLKQLQPAVGRSAMFTPIFLNLIGFFKRCEIRGQFYMLIILWWSFLSHVWVFFELWNPPSVVVYWIHVEVEQVNSMA